MKMARLTMSQIFTVLDKQSLFQGLRKKSHGKSYY